jgi:hypothetical protein
MMRATFWTPCASFTEAPPNLNIFIDEWGRRLIEDFVVVLQNKYQLL